MEVLPVTVGVHNTLSLIKTILFVQHMLTLPLFWGKPATTMISPKCVQMGKFCITNLATLDPEMDVGSPSVSKLTTLTILALLITFGLFVWLADLKKVKKWPFSDFRVVTHFCRKNRSRGRKSDLKTAEAFYCSPLSIPGLRSYIETLWRTLFCPNHYQTRQILVFFALCASQASSSWHLRRV